MEPSSVPLSAKNILRGLLITLALAYPLAVIAFWLLVSRVGEGWWLTTAAMYLPVALLLVPLPLLSLPLAVWGPRRLLLGQGLAAAVIVFPIMGLALGGPVAPSRPKTLRVLSFNVDYGSTSLSLMRAEIADARPDVVVIQTANDRVKAAVYFHVIGFYSRVAGELFVASRYPIVATLEAPGAEPAYFRVTLDTPLGLLDLYNVHPLSPRKGLEALRQGGLAGAARLITNTAVRTRQVAAIAAVAAASPNPVIIAGDTNLPGLSRTLRTQLGRWQDGFAEVGRGLGYTFPADAGRPWMRIDRILAGPELRFLRFEVGRRRASDHHAVWADLERRQRGNSAR